MYSGQSGNEEFIPERFTPEEWNQILNEQANSFADSLPERLNVAGHLSRRDKIIAMLLGNIRQESIESSADVWFNSIIAGLGLSFLY